MSPGPGEPKDYPKTTKIYKKYKGKKKILGICLGFQQIVYSEGAKNSTKEHFAWLSKLHKNNKSQINL